MKKLLVATASVLGVGTMASAGSDIYITQSGSEQMASMEQYDGSKSKAWIDQAGSSNQAVAAQTGKNNQLKINQDGVDNVAGKAYAWGVFYPAPNSHASIQQIGNNNYAQIEQDGKHNKVSSYLFWQNGNGNDARVRQLGLDNFINHVQQYGNGNKASLKQDGKANRISTASSDGNNNKIKIEQDGNSNGTGSSFGGLVMDVSQVPFLDSGNSKASEVRQRGTGNLADIKQIGNNNSFQVLQGKWPDLMTNGEVKMRQMGKLHYAHTQQIGNGHMANVQQTGTSNAAYTYQSN